MDVVNIIIESIYQVAGATVLLFSLVVSIIIIFVDPTDNQEKILGTMFIVGLVVFANNEWVYLFGIVVIGTLITGPEFMIEFLKAYKTSRTESSSESIYTTKAPELENESHNLSKIK